MARIPEPALQEIRDRVDIVELVGETVALKRHGRNFVGLCPFHREKTPSFNVSAELQIFKCFGCGVGGNAITFTMARDGLDFPEAARRLAARAGIEVPADGGDARPRWQSLYEANAFAAEFYALALREDPGAATARDYLTGREVPQDAWAGFGLGWAAGGWDGLLVAARAAGLGDEALVEAGLASRSERTGGLYDRFRSRIVFPIAEAGGRVVGFSGRRVEEGGDAPKYLNTPETPVFRKGALLFGLSVAKNAVRRAEEVIVVEGNFDLLSLHVRGFTQAVAPLGTALTTEQALLIRRYAARAVLLYDSDEAGLKAAFRSGDELLARGFSVRVAFLPPGNDPDSFVRREGAPALRELLRDAPDLVAAKLRVLRERLDLGRVDAKRRAIDLLLRSIRRIPDPITRELQVGFVADELGVDPRLLGREGRPRVRGRKPAADGESSAGAGRAAGRSERVPLAERYLLLLLLRRPERLGTARAEIVPEDFITPVSRRVYELLLETDREGGPRGERALLDRAEPEVQALLSELLLSEESLDAEEAIFADALLRVKETAKERELAELRKAGGDLEAVWTLSRERLRLRSSRGRPA